LFFERVLLSFLLGNGDAHLKNFSVLETDDGGLRLSPAYDIVCSKAVIPRETDCALTPNGKQNKIGRGDFERLAEASVIPAKAVSRIFERFKRGYSATLSMIPSSRLPEDIQGRVRRIVEERYRRLFGR